MKKIKIAAHVNRDMKHVTCMYYHPYKKRIEMVQEELTGEDIQDVRERTRRDPDMMTLPFEVLIGHDSDNEVNSIYRITSNRYGINTVPWSLVKQEEISKKATIAAFETCDSERLLLIGAGKNIVAACYAYDDDFIISDTHVTRSPDYPIAYTVLDDRLYILLSEEGYDIVYCIESNNYVDFNDVIDSFKAGKGIAL